VLAIVPGLRPVSEVADDVLQVATGTGAEIADVRTGHP
jgi:hypothetical protein